MTRFPPIAPLIALTLSVSLLTTGAFADTLYVKPDASLNARSGPGTGYARERTLSPGTAVTVVQRRGDWAQIRIGDLLLWVFASYLTDHAPAHPPMVVAPQPKPQPAPVAKPDPVKKPAPVSKPVTKPVTKPGPNPAPVTKKPQPPQPQPQPLEDDGTPPTPKRPGA